jgi:hypothetical protein
MLIFNGINGFLYLKIVGQSQIGLTETTHLFRALNCTYYTCICLPKKRRVHGFPFVHLTDAL